MSKNARNKIKRTFSLRPQVMWFLRIGQKLWLLWSFNQVFFYQNKASFDSTFVFISTADGALMVDIYHSIPSNPSVAREFWVFKTVLCEANLNQTVLRGSKIFQWVPIISSGVPKGFSWVPTGSRRVHYWFNRVPNGSSKGCNGSRGVLNKSSRVLKGSSRVPTVKEGSPADQVGPPVGPERVQ